MKIKARKSIITAVEINISAMLIQKKLTTALFTFLIGHFLSLGNFFAGGIALIVNIKMCTWSTLLGGFGGL